MYKIVNNTVKVPLTKLNDPMYKDIEVINKGRVYAYLALDQYEDFLAILQKTKFRKNDRVFWVKINLQSSKLPNEINENTIRTNRIDVITRVNLSFNRYTMLLDTSIRYDTLEINVDKPKRGLAYESFLVKVSEYNEINGTNF